MQPYGGAAQRRSSLPVRGTQQGDSGYRGRSRRIVPRSRQCVPILTFFTYDRADELSTASPISSRGSTPSASSTSGGNRPSISRLSTWTHLLDKEERHATVYEGEGPDGEGAVPAAAGASFFSRSASTPSGPPSTGPYQTSTNSVVTSAIFDTQLGTLVDVPFDQSIDPSSFNAFLHQSSPPFQAHPPQPPYQSPHHPAYHTPPSSFPNLTFSSHPPLPDNLSFLADSLSADSSNDSPANSCGSSGTSPAAPVPTEQFSEAFIASFLDSLVAEAGAAGSSGTATTSERYGGLEAPLLDGGWCEQVRGEGADGTKRGDAFDIDSIFPAAQQW
jgi:hypothetical protein